MPELPPALQGWLFNQGVAVERPIVPTDGATLDRLADLYAEMWTIEKRMARGCALEYPDGPEGERSPDWNDADEAKLVWLADEWIRVTSEIEEVGLTARRG